MHAVPIQQFWPSLTRAHRTTPPVVDGVGNTTAATFPAQDKACFYYGHRFGGHRSIKNHQKALTRQQLWKKFHHQCSPHLTSAPNASSAAATAYSDPVHSTSTVIPSPLRTPDSPASRAAPSSGPLTADAVSTVFSPGVEISESFSKNSSAVPLRVELSPPPLRAWREIHT